MEQLNMWERRVIDLRERCCLLKYDVHRKKAVLPLVATPTEIRKINSNMRQLSKLVPTLKPTLKDPERIQKYYKIMRLLDESDDFMNVIQMRTDYLDRLFKPVAEGA